MRDSVERVHIACRQRGLADSEPSRQGFSYDQATFSLDGWEMASSIMISHMATGWLTTLFVNCLCPERACGMS